VTVEPVPTINSPAETNILAHGLRMLTSSRVWLIVIALVVISFIEWLFAPAPATPGPLPQTGEPWHIPQAPKAQTEKALAILKQASLWGKLPDAAASKPLNDPAWRFLGIVKNGPQRFVMIQIEGQPERMLTVSDRLPGGSRILKIEDDTLCLLINGKKRSLPIYRQSAQIL